LTLLRRQHAALILLLISLCVSCSAYSVDPIQSSELRIGSWNIQNLGSRPWGQEPQDLADHIRASGADVLALQEIHDDDGRDKTRTNAKLDQIVELLNEGGSAWQYQLYPRREPRNPEQLLGIAWNSRRVEPNGKPLRISVSYESGRSWRRHPYAVPFRPVEGGTDFVLIPLHSKSNSDGEELGRRVRRGEAHALVAQLAAVRRHFKDDDLIILGDFNTIDADEEGLRLFREAGFIDLNSEDRPTYSTRRFPNSPLDRILVPTEQPEFAESRFEVMTPRDPGRHVQRLSDHHLIYTTIQVVADDDGS